MVEGCPGIIDTCYQLVSKVIKSSGIRHHVDQLIVTYLSSGAAAAHLQDPISPQGP